MNDRVETRAVRLAFGRAAARLPGSSIKSMIGHPQGACGAAGVAGTLLAMRDSFLPPTINLERPDPECDLDYVANAVAGGVVRARALQLHRLRVEEQRARPLPGKLSRGSSDPAPEPRVSLLVPARRPADEFLDDAALPADEMARSLRDLALVNRWWGGAGALPRLIEGAPRGGESRRGPILDVAAGSAHVTRRLRRRLARTGPEPFAVALDVQWRHLVAGRRISPGEPLAAVAADGFRLPFPDGSFEWAVSTLAFHHFAPEENVRLLRELARVARPASR